MIIDPETGKPMPSPTMGKLLEGFKADETIPIPTGWYKNFDSVNQGLQGEFRRGVEMMMVGGRSSGRSTIVEHSLNKAITSYIQAGQILPISLGLIVDGEPADHKLGNDVSMVDLAQLYADESCAVSLNDAYIWASVIAAIGVHGRSIMQLMDINRKVYLRNNHGAHVAAWMYNALTPEEQAKFNESKRATAGPRVVHISLEGPFPETNYFKGLVKTEDKIEVDSMAELPTSPGRVYRVASPTSVSIPTRVVTNVEPLPDDPWPAKPRREQNYLQLRKGFRK